MSRTHTYVLPTTWRYPDEIARIAEQLDEHELAPRHCPRDFRLITAEAARCDDDLLLAYGGQVVDYAEPHMYGWLIRIDGLSKNVPTHWLTEESNHSWVDTGMRRSWCKRCEAPAVWDFASCSFKPE